MTSVRSMVRDFTRILSEWKDNIKAVRDRATMVDYSWSLIWQNKSGHKRTVRSTLHF